jgi:hypothetical protein
VEEKILIREFNVENTRKEKLDFEIPAHAVLLLQLQLE